MMDKQDIQTIEQRGSNIETVNEQLDRLKNGFPYLKLYNSAKIGAGIFHLSPDEETTALKRWEEYLADGGKVMKFVPASGAASRMFKSLFSFVDGEENEPMPGSDVSQIIKDVKKLPFYNILNDKCKEIYSKSVEELIQEKRQKDVISAIVKENGLNYGNLPKGLLLFHAYEEDSPRTPVEEQLMEGAQSAKSSDGTVHLHFTVSSNHRKLFEKKLAETVPAIEKKTGVKFDISLSEQKPSTDTIAANEDGTPFRENGSLVFRPGGHGALISNLNDVDAEVVFIKNIDNVVPDSLREVTLKYKKILGGILVETHDHIIDFLEALESPNVDDTKIREIVSFLHGDLFIKFQEPESREELISFLKKKLNRPLRVCGMVRNEGEPGGGPFIAYNKDGSASPQILESTQIDPNNEEYKEMMKTATHFNPVDLVCYLKDPAGKSYNLPDYVDADTGFISSKSLHGKSLKALELPGLWNGAMSDWNTIFVEVPSETFNPVKTVNDLLRPAHQG
ncbi:MAG: DUF4301 family protein [Muribaculaceae bacterium]|nr:DUF4301 family protein [Muribaculaceae bacterium]